MNSVFAQYEELPSPQFAVINLSLRLRLITANFGLDTNSSYRAQPHSIIVNCRVEYTENYKGCKISPFYEKSPKKPRSILLET